MGNKTSKKNPYEIVGEDVDVDVDDAKYYVHEGPRRVVFAGSSRSTTIGLDDSLFGLSWVTLRGVHVATCALHLGGIALAASFLGMGEDWSIPVVTSFADWRQRDPKMKGCDDDNCVVAPAHARLGGGRISLEGLVVAFHALSLAWQFAVLVDECGGRDGVRARYLRQLQSGRNGFRWFEYALSAPLMTVVIAVVFGIVDFYALLALAACTSGLQFFGYVQEIFLRHGKGINDRFVVLSPIVAGFVFWIGYWSVIAAAFHQSVTSSRATPPAEMTAAIWTMFIVMTLMYASFAFVLAYDVSKRVANDRRDATTYYANVEGAYCLLSVSSKTALGALLAWIVRVRATVIGLEFVVDPPCVDGSLGNAIANVTNVTLT